MYYYIIGSLILSTMVLIYITLKLTLLYISPELREELSENVEGTMEDFFIDDGPAIKKNN